MLLCEPNIINLNLGRRFAHSRGYLSPPGSLLLTVLKGFYLVQFLLNLDWSRYFVSYLLFCC